MMKRLGMGIGVVLVISFFVFYPLYPVLKITTPRNDHVLLCARMADGEEFTLSFIHSVNRRPVYDTIRREGNHLLIVKSRFDSFGAGMPEGSTDREKLQFGKDGWLEWMVNRSVSEVSFFVGWVANHSLEIKGQNIALADLAEPGTLLSLRIQKVSYYELLKGRCLQ
jgi:hypothetical protein